MHFSHQTNFVIVQRIRWKVLTYMGNIARKTKRSSIRFFKHVVQRIEIRNYPVSGIFNIDEISFAFLISLSDIDKSKCYRVGISNIIDVMILENMKEIMIDLSR